MFRQKNKPHVIILQVTLHFFPKRNLNMSWHKGGKSVKFSTGPGDVTLKPHIKLYSKSYFNPEEQALCNTSGHNASIGCGVCYR